ncbi:hypothetical protein N9W93_00695 [Gammaproteobacteria bacterium]|jgi:hypothetical protein|nr:hypothetical protein [Gammaproteobacteria bacterium]
MPDFLIKGDITEFLLICILVSIILKTLFTPNSGVDEIGFLNGFLFLLAIILVISFLIFAFFVIGESFILPLL